MTKNVGVLWGVFFLSMLLTHNFLEQIFTACILSGKNVLQIYPNHSTVAITCTQKPFKEEIEFGLYRQVVFIWRFLWVFLLQSIKGYKSVTLTQRMVLIGRVSLTQV